MTRSVARPPLGQGWGTLWAEVEAAAGRRHHPLRPRDRPHPGRPSAAAVPGPADPVDPVGPVAPVAPAADQQMADPPSTVAPEEQAGTAESAAPAAPGQDIPADSAPDIGEIVLAAQNGDAAAFGELYDRYVDTVYRYVYYRVPDRATAEDMTSETFTRALRRIDSFSWKGRDFAAWLITIARNLLADHYKSSRYRLEVPTDDMATAAGNRTDAGPEDQVLDALTNRTLLAAVQSLRPDQQECVVLRFLQGMSVSETALIMGRNEGAIKALQYRAVRALARKVPKENVT